MLRRLRHLIDFPDAWSLLHEAGHAWVDDRASSMGAALAYYTLFSIAPLALIAVAVAGLVFGEDAARGEIVQELRGLVGQDGAAAIQALLERVNKPFSGILATAVGVGALLIGATTVFSELQNALDRIWRAPEPARARSVWVWARARLLSLGMIMAIGFMLVVSLIASAALSALQKWWSPLFGDAALWLVNGGDFAFSFVTITVAFALIYKLMPRVHVRWRDVWVGAVMTSLLFTLGKTLIGLYVGTTGFASPFGAAGSLVVLVFWVYWSAQIFLFGAEFTRVYACRRGAHTPLSLA